MFVLLLLQKYPVIVAKQYYTVFCFLENQLTKTKRKLIDKKYK